MKPLICMVFVALLSFESNAQNQITWDQDKVNEFVKLTYQQEILSAVLGDVARKNSTSPEIRKLAGDEWKEHSEAANRLKSFDKALSELSIDDNGQYLIDKVRNTKGDFDKTYLDVLIRDHERSLREFHAARESIDDVTLKVWLTEYLPTLRESLDEAQRLKDNLEKMARWTESKNK